MTNSIAIRRPLATYLLQLAQESPEAAIGGIVSAVDDTPKTVYPIRNTIAASENQYQIDLEEYAAALQKANSHNERLFAIYHSQMNPIQQPLTDTLLSIEQPGIYQLIISLNTKGVLEMRAFQMQADRMQEIKLTI